MLSSLEYRQLDPKLIGDWHQALAWASVGRVVHDDMVNLTQVLEEDWFEGVPDNGEGENVESEEEEFLDSLPLHRVHAFLEYEHFQDACYRPIAWRILQMLEGFRLRFTQDMFLRRDCGSSLASGFSRFYDFGETFKFVWSRAFKFGKSTFARDDVLTNISSDIQANDEHEETQPVEQVYNIALHRGIPWGNDFGRDGNALYQQALQQIFGEAVLHHDSSTVGEESSVYKCAREDNPCCEQIREQQIDHEFQNGRNRPRKNWGHRAEVILKLIETASDLKRTKPVNYLEIGVLEGDVTATVVEHFIAADNAKKPALIVHAVDPFETLKEVDPEYYKAIYSHSHSSNRVQERLTKARSARGSRSEDVVFNVHVANSHDFARMGQLFPIEVAGKWQNINEKATTMEPFDVAFQDGAHSHIGVLKDLAWLWGRMRRGGRSFLVVHDFGLWSFVGVFKAVIEWAAFARVQDPEDRFRLHIGPDFTVWFEFY